MNNRDYNVVFPPSVKVVYAFIIYGTCIALPSLHIYILHILSTLQTSLQIYMTSRDTTHNFETTTAFGRFNNYVCTTLGYDKYEYGNTLLLPGTCTILETTSSSSSITTSTQHTRQLHDVQGKKRRRTQLYCTTNFRPARWSPC